MNTYRLPQRRGIAEARSGLPERANTNNYLLKGAARLEGHHDHAVGIVTR
jgi:hypothetical protein